MFLGSFMMLIFLSVCCPLMNESTKLEYQDAFGKSGHKSTLKCKPKNTSGKNRNKCRNIMGFNPPFNKSATKNVTKIFFRLFDKHFPKST